ncbi:MAG: SufE family protein [Acidimicrobiia bacterium]|nr:SufE family protein [Acidimicrobiia bacterium]
MLPASLQRLVELFASSPKQIKVQALVDYSDRLAEPPADVIGEGHLEQVHECQTPFFVATEVADDGTVQLYLDVPREAPTMRGYAGILSDGLNGATVDEILAIPETFYLDMGLAEVVSQLRVRGMAAIMATIKAQLRAAAA